MTHIQKNGQSRFFANITTVIYPLVSSTNCVQSITVQELTYLFNYDKSPMGKGKWLWKVQNYFDHTIVRFWNILSLSVRIFLQTDGAQSAGAFAYYAFFSLFPLIILFVTIASLFIDRGRAGMEVVAYVETYIPISGEMQSYIFDTITGVINTRKQASVTAFFMLVWSAMQFFNTLICLANRAWGVEFSNWWRSPLKSLFFSPLWFV